MRLVHSNPELLAFSILRMVLQECCKESVVLMIGGCEIRSFSIVNNECCVEIDTRFRSRADSDKDDDVVWRCVSATIPIAMVPKKKICRVDIGAKVVIFIEEDRWCSFAYEGNGRWHSEEDVCV